jgi:signal transduction histidine kinase
MMRLLYSATRLPLVLTVLTGVVYRLIVTFGLGLAVGRAIVRAHGGSITAANRPDRGAAFVISLPLPKDTPQVVVE